MYTLNDKLLVEPYKLGQGLKPEIRNGLAVVEQKVNLVGLKLLADAKLNSGEILEKGAVIYFREEDLCNKMSVWAQRQMKSDFTEDKFLIADKKDVVAIVKDPH